MHSAIDKLYQDILSPRKKVAKPQNKRTPRRSRQTKRVHLPRTSKRTALFNDPTSFEFDEQTGKV